MQTFRRILLTSSLAIAACSVASASIIYSGPVTNCVGLACTVTETGTLTNATFQIGEGSNQTPSLFTFDKFGALGTGGTLSNATFDYQFQSVVTGFKVTNNDTNSDSATVTLTSDSLVDPGTTLSAADVKGIVKLGDVNAASLGFSGTSIANYELLKTIFNTGSFTVNGTSCDTVANPGCNTAAATVPSFTDNVSTGYPAGTFFSAPYTLTTDLTGAGTFSFGTTDTLAYGVTNNGNAGSINLNVQYNSNYNSTARVVYSYTLPNPPSETPEPATFALFGGALLGIGVLRKRASR